MTDTNVVYMFPDNAFGVVFLPHGGESLDEPIEDGKSLTSLPTITDEDIDVDALIDEGNALIASWPTVAEVEAQKKADRRKHLRLV